MISPKADRLTKLKVMLTKAFASAGPGFVAALSIGIISITLNIIAARQLVLIGNDSKDVTETWIARTASLASLQDILADFRQQEARLALTQDTTVRRQVSDSLTRLIAQSEAGLVRIAALSMSPDDARQAGSLLSIWNEYRREYYESRVLATGEGSAAILAFREREPLFASLVNQTRVTRDAMTKGLDMLVSRNQRSSRTSTVLLISGIFLTLGAFVVLIALRRSSRARITAENRLLSVIDQSLGIVWEMSRYGRLRYCSKAGYELLQYEPGTLVGVRILSLIHPEDRRRAFNAAIEALTNDLPLGNLELRLLGRDGSTHWVAVSGKLIIKDALTPHLFSGRGLAVDVTRRYQAELALAQNRRLEALGTLAGGVAHDLNNVFTAVNGYADLLRDQVEDRPDLSADLAAIEAAAQRGTLLVRRILQFARQQVREPRAVSMSDTVQEVVQLLRPQTPSHVRIVVEDLCNGCLVWSDPTELHQIIVNIASNGLHAMETVGTTLKIHLEADETIVHLVISDDGVGMTEEVKERAVEPFFTTRPIGEGTGMGLSVVHGIVKSLNGTLRLTSAPGNGTSVAITLPRAHSGKLDAVATLASNPRNNRSVRVLLVDDEDQVRQSVSRILTLAGCQVEAVASGKEALTELSTDVSKYDLVITDFTMPTMSGIELAEEIRSLSQSIPIVLVSGYLDENTTTKAIAIGITRVLDKPVPRQVLLEVVHSTTDHEIH